MTLPAAVPDVLKKPKILSKSALAASGGPNDLPDRVRFGEVELSRSERRITIGGTNARLGPRASDVLWVLVDERHRVVSKEELLERVWAGLIVEDANVEVQVAAIRRLIGPSTIATIPRFGYRFTAAISEPAITGRAAELEDPRPSIIVLPFQSSDDDRTLGQGIIEGVIHVLSGLHDLFVIARGSSIRYTGAEEPTAVGNQLQVGYVLGGSIWRDGTRIRTTFSLTDARAGKLVHSGRFDGDHERLFELQDRIADQIVAAIAPEVRQHELQRARRKPPTSLTAYELMLRGIDSMIVLSRDAFENARTLLEQSIEHDPEFSTPYAYLSLWHRLWGGQGWSADLDADDRQAVRRAAEAIERDRRNAFALAIYGFMCGCYSRDHEQAQEILREALQRGPNSPTAWTMSSFVETYAGNTAGAIDHARRAIALSPLDPLLFWHEYALSQALLVHGDFQAALRWSRQSQRRSHPHAANLRIQAASLAAVGRIDEARAIVRQVLQLDHKFTLTQWAQRTPFKGAVLETTLRHFEAAGFPA